MFYTATLRYFDEIRLPGKRLAKGCGVSHSRIYLLRNRTVGAAGILGNRERVRLRLSDVRSSERTRVLSSAFLVRLG